MKTEASPLSDFFGDIIFSYTRTQAIADGVLIPVSPELCKDAGVIIPVCVTDTLWNGYIDPVNLSQLPGQSVEGRLWDLLWMFRNCASSPQWRGADRIRYRVIFLMKTGKTRSRQETVTVIGACGPGDDGEPVITLMLPEDD